MFDSFNNCLIVVRHGFNLVFVVRMVLDVRLNWLYDVKKVQPHPIIIPSEQAKLSNIQFNGVIFCVMSTATDRQPIRRRKSKQRSN
jgi:hypothetical protein